MDPPQRTACVNIIDWTRTQEPEACVPTIDIKTSLRDTRVRLRTCHYPCIHVQYGHDDVDRKCGSLANGVPEAKINAAALLRPPSTSLLAGLLNLHASSTLIALSARPSLLSLGCGLSHGMAEASTSTSASASFASSRLTHVGVEPPSTRPVKYTPTASFEVEEPGLPSQTIFKPHRHSWAHRLQTALCLDNPRVQRIWRYIRGPRPKVDLPGTYWPRLSGRTL